jgi:hypothetical protein
MILFLDTEFGQIYGSWRRDFILTEIGAIYTNKNFENIKIRHIKAKPDLDLVFRGMIFKDEKYQLEEKVVNLKTNKIKNFDPNFKIQRPKARELRKKSRKDTNIFRKEFNSIFKNVTEIVLFGGNEDINQIKSLGYDLNKKNIKITDLQSILHKNTNKLLGLNIYRKIINYQVSNKYIYSENFRESIPKNFSKKRFVPHNPIGDASVTKMLYLEVSRSNSNLIEKIKSFSMQK